MCVRYVYLYEHSAKHTYRTSLYPKGTFRYVVLSDSAETGERNFVYMLIL